MPTATRTPHPTLDSATYTPRPTSKPRPTDELTAVTLYCADCSADFEVHLWEYARFPRPLAGQPNTVVGGFPNGTPCDQLPQTQTAVQDGGQTRGEFVRVRCKGVTGWLLKEFVR